MLYLLNDQRELLAEGSQIQVLKVYFEFSWISYFPLEHDEYAHCTNLWLTSSLSMHTMPTHAFEYTYLRL